MRRSVSIITAILIIGALFAGCSQKQPAAATPATTNQVLTVDKANKVVKVQAEVNAKYFTESTRHGVVFKDGTNGEKAVLRALANPIDFYNALITIGATPGNNMKNKGDKVQGSKLNVTVSWDGLAKEIPFNDIIKSSDVRPMDIRFGGNLETQKKANTGCILCLDSCPAGITSNAAYAFGESDTVKFYGNKDVLPKDGTKVTVIFKLAD